MNNLVSIILPTYNGENYIEQALMSCFNQTYKNIELIVVIDGSKDRTQEILKEFVDPRLRIVYNIKNLGLPESLNVGFHLSTGYYLTWTSDDNLYSPSAIESMVDFLDRNPFFDMTYSCYWIINSKGEMIDQSIMYSPDQITDGNIIGPCFLYTRNVYERIGDYNPKYKLVEDYEYWIRISQQFKIAGLNKYLYYYRHHNNSLTGVYGSYIIEKISAKMKFEEGIYDLKKYRKRVAYIHICEAFESYKDNNLINVRRNIFQAIINDVSSINRGVVSIFIESILGSKITNFLRKLLCI